MAEATLLRNDPPSFVAETVLTAGQVVQLGDGRAAVITADFADGQTVPASSIVTTGKVYQVTKTTGSAILKGGRVYWDHSANSATYCKANDRDFYLGRAADDASANDTTVNVALNADPAYDLDLARDPFATTIIGTQAPGGLGLYRRGGAHKLALDSTSEAQKVDALGKDGFSKNANAIVEIAFAVVNGSAGAAPDLSLGIANATHATDADSIAEHLLIHVDGNSTTLKLQSKDGTTTVAATSTVTTYTAGALNREEWWFDLRNPADVQVYRNGVLMLGSTVFRLDNATGPLCLLAHLEKTAAADVFDVDVDWFRARFAEQ